MRLDELAIRLANAKTTAPRGLKTKEILNAQFVVDDPYMTFECRKLSLKYMKAEALWYLSGDPYNDSILKFAKIWGQIRQDNGEFFSNYGQYWFGKQNGFKWVVDQLSRDEDSRQAVIPMLSKDHCFEGNKDVVCTSGVFFNIRDGKLNMTVVMRSSDFILGYAYDLPMFTMLHQMVYFQLVNSHYPRLELGEYTHNSISLHVYEKHWVMLEKIANNEGRYEIDIPMADAPYDLISGAFRSKFGQWLLEG